MTLRRITRNRRLSPEEAAKYREIREQVTEDLPDLIARYRERLIAAGEEVTGFDREEAERKLPPGGAAPSG